MFFSNKTSVRVEFSLLLLLSFFLFLFVWVYVCVRFVRLCVVWAALTAVLCWR